MTWHETRPVWYALDCMLKLSKSIPEKVKPEDFLTVIIVNNVLFANIGFTSTSKYFFFIIKYHYLLLLFFFWVNDTVNVTVAIKWSTI